MSEPKVHFLSYLDRTSGAKRTRVAACGYREDASVVAVEDRVTRDACLVTCEKCIDKIPVATGGGGAGNAADLQRTVWCNPHSDGQRNGCVAVIWQGETHRETGRLAGITANMWLTREEAVAIYRDLGVILDDCRTGD